MKQIYHHYTKWECYKNGFYASKHKHLSHEECENIFKNYFKNLNVFEQDINKVFKKWKYSCEQFLTNKNINRVAWLGQACVCINKKIPSRYKYSYNFLSEKEKQKANDLAQRKINEWIKNFCKLHGLKYEIKIKQKSMSLFDF